jgi:hypothetical protein
MKEPHDIAGPRLPDLERMTIASLQHTLREGASGGRQSVAYMLAVGELEEIEAKVRRGERVQGADALFLSTARKVMA